MGTAADYDNDGDLDITVVNYLEYDFSDAPSTYDGLIGYSTPRLFKNTTDILYRNNNNGTFTDITKEAGLSNPVEGKGMGSVSADFDNGNFPDIYITNDTCRDFLYHNNDDGIFTDETVAAGLSEPTHLLVGFSPSFLDYAMAVWTYLLLMDTPKTSLNRWKLLRHTPQSDQLYRNNRNGTFTDMSSLSSNSYFSERYVGRATATGDYDNDGDIDIFVVNSNQEAILLRNEEGNRNNWIQIKLVGRQSNRDGIQARIQISCGGMEQMREVKNGSCYASESDKRLLFGLEKKTE